MADSGILSSRWLTNASFFVGGIMFIYLASPLVYLVWPSKRQSSRRLLTSADDQDAQDGAFDRGTAKVDLRGTNAKA